MRALRRAAALAAAACIPLVAAPFTASATPEFGFDRVAGDDRYATAAKLALEAFPGGAAQVVVARGDEPWDALAGAYLAGILRAPVLLVTRDAVPGPTAEALKSMRATTVTLLGGPNAISAAVATALDADYDVKRVEGPTRYATAAAIARTAGTGAPGKVNDKVTAILASGESFADALAAGAMSYAGLLPIVLTPPGQLGADASAALSAVKAQHVLIVGGPQVVLPAVSEQVKLLGMTVERVGGDNRAGTAALLADWALLNLPGWSDTEVDLANGNTFGDALAGGPAAGRAGRSLLLNSGAALSPEVREWLSAHTATLVDGRALGGPVTLPKAILDAADTAARGLAGPLTGTVVAVDAVNHRYDLAPDTASVATPVTWAPGDAFKVGGAEATIGAFEAALTVADTVVHTPATATAPARHELTNVVETDLVSGTVGNVDLARRQLDLVHPGTGHALRRNVQWGTANTYVIDGASAAATQAAFEADVSEGDAITMALAGGGTRLSLTNKTVSGRAAAIAADGPPAGLVNPAVRFRAGGFGDDPASGEDSPDGVAGSDSAFVANGGPTATDTYTVDGAAQTGPNAQSAFAGALTAGDTVTYGRKGGVESFALVNAKPPLVTGVAAAPLDGDGDGVPLTPAGGDGGSFTVVGRSGPDTVTYGSQGVFVVDGRIATEAELEAAYSAGDGISFQAADPASSTQQELRLVSGPVEGTVDPASVNTGDAPGAPGSPAPNSYAVLGPDGRTRLDTVTYSSVMAAANTYLIGDKTATLEEFEAALTSIKDAKATATATVRVIGTGAQQVTEHRLVLTPT